MGKMDTINGITSAMEAARNSTTAGEPLPTDFKVEAADRSSKEGYVSFDEICGYKTGIDKHFRKYEASEWDEKVQGLIPVTDPTIKLDKEYAVAVCMCIEHGQSLLGFGPPGTGKTVTPREVCARLGYPFLYIQGMGGTEPADYVGSPYLEKAAGSDGSVTSVMSWKDGIASYAVRYGAFLLFDEPFKTSAQTNMCFQSLLDDRRELKLYGHPDPIQSTLKAHPNFRICLADNVRGVGDNMGKYAAEIQDQSTMDRIDLVVEVPYPQQDDEVAIMSKKFPDIDAKLIKKVVMTGGLIRRAWAKDDVSLPFTLRKTQNWLKNIKETGDIALAFKLSYLNSCTSDDEKKAVTKAYNSIKFGDSL